MTDDWQERKSFKSFDWTVSAVIALQTCIWSGGNVFKTIDNRTKSLSQVSVLFILSFFLFSFFHFSIQERFVAPGLRMDACEIKNQKCRLYLLSKVVHDNKKKDADDANERRSPSLALVRVVISFILFQT